MPILINSNNDPDSAIKANLTTTCPECGNATSLTVISIPRYELLRKHTPKALGFVFMCNACQAPIFIKFTNIHYNTSDIQVIDHKSFYEEIIKHVDPFDFEYLPKDVSEDFREALICFADSCFNAFTAMCRRTIQSAFMELGAKGKDKVQDQLKEIADEGGIDEESYELIKQIILSGHDGAHPHLPKVSKDRAGIILELMKDILYELFVRKAKIKEAVLLRKRDIENREQQTQPS